MGNARAHLFFRPRFSGVYSSPFLPGVPGYRAPAGFARITDSRSPFSGRIQAGSMAKGKNTERLKNGRSAVSLLFLYRNPDGALVIRRLEIPL